MIKFFLPMTTKRSAILLAAFCLITGLAVMLVGQNVSERTKHLNTEWDDFELTISAKEHALSVLHRSLGFGGMIHQFKDYVLRQDEPHIAKLSSHVNNALATIEIYRSLGITPAESTALMQIESIVKTYAAKILDVKQLIAEGRSIAQIDAAIKINDTPAFQSLHNLEKYISSARESSIEDFRNDLNNISSIVHLAAYGFPLLLLTMAGFTGYGVWSLLQQLGGEPSEVTRLSRQVAKGNLDSKKYHLNTNSSSAMGSLIATVCKLVEVIAEIRTSANSVDTSAKTINQQNLELHDRTTRQAASLVETSANMDEITATVKQNADSAQQANKLTKSAQKRAEQGGIAVKEVVTAMSEIHTSSEKIGTIISVIDEIAFQTNLLALNAAVEAARAGDQGRGFAVVAGEVGNLAQRSASAAKEIKILIEDSVSKVESGSKLVNDAGSTLSELIDSVQKVSGIMEQMVVASNEQAKGIEQVNLAINQMDSETQQNTELVQKASEASASMTEQALLLRKGVEFFKLDEDKRSTAELPLDPPSPSPKTEPSYQPNHNDLQHWTGKERRSKVRPWSESSQAAKPEALKKPEAKTDPEDLWTSF
jgi:methyl-accepting chemotaxis protein